MISTPYLVWDSSALVKRYLHEVGAPTVDTLFRSGLRSVGALLIYAEASAIIRRNFNAGEITLRRFNEARFLLEQEVLLAPDFPLLSLDDQDILDGIALTDRHNLNTADAPMLSAYLRQARSVAGTPVLIASDLRLIRAAAAEGLRTLNPTTVNPADVPAALGADQS